jgi:hypothetical protein
MFKMSEVQNGTVVSGSGVTNATGETYMVHNPAPRTERGKRRHEKRTENEKIHAKSVWNTPPKRTWHKPDTCNHVGCKANRK